MQFLCSTTKTNFHNGQIHYITDKGKNCNHYISRPKKLPFLDPIQMQIQEFVKGAPGPEV